MNWIVVIMSVILGACSSAKTDPDGKGPADASPTTCPVCIACPACPTCSAPPPCPACEKSDAIFYTVVLQLIRGEPEMFLTNVSVHRGGRWYDVDMADASGPRGADDGPRTDLPQGDLLLAHVRAQPANVGRVVVDDVTYQQRAGTLTTWDFGENTDVRGKVFLVTLFATLK